MIIEVTYQRKNGETNKVVYPSTPILTMGYIADSAKSMGAKVKAVRDWSKHHVPVKISKVSVRA